VSNPFPTVELDNDVAIKIGDLLGDIWVQGMRHQMALCIAGMLVHRSVCLLSARSVVARASNKAGGDTDHRLKDVDSTYEKWCRNEKVMGSTELETVIRESVPAVYLDKTLKTLEQVKRLLPRLPATGPAPQDDAPPFKIISIVMFNSKPAHWQVTLEVKDGTRHTTTVQTTAFTRYTLFRDAFLEDTLTILPELKNSEWTRLIETYGQPEVKSAPMQAVGAETMKEPLVEFLAEAKENPDAGVLRAFAGVDQDSHFFRYSAFDNFLRSNNLTFDRQAAYDMLKNLGFQNTTKRLPDHKTVNVWFKKKDQAP
jgi:hypothetical protein